MFCLFLLFCDVIAQTKENQSNSNETRHMNRLTAADFQRVALQVPNVER